MSINSLVKKYLCRSTSYSSDICVDQPSNHLTDIRIYVSAVVNKIITVDPDYLNNNFVKISYSNKHNVNFFEIRDILTIFWQQGKP